MNNTYVPTVKGIRTMDMIGQRLFTGRIAVAQAALTFARRLFATTRGYSDAKMCTMRGETPALSDVPQLRALYDEADARLDEMNRFVGVCEAHLRGCLTRGDIPSAALTRAIAVCKIRAVETAIELCFRLKQEVGSYALMDGTGFGHTDFLQCCKFAEGDSRILSQKLSRDAFGEYTKTGGRPASDWSAAELAVCERIAKTMQTEMANKVGKMQAWDAAWTDVYALANAICDRVMKEWTVGNCPRAKM